MSFFLRLLGLGNTPFDAVNIQQYKEDYFGQKNHVLIDVRTVGEFKQGHLKGAKNIPLDRIENKLDKIPRDKTVVVMCRSGNRSRMACSKLAQAGYDNITNFKGGIIAWQIAGYDVRR